MLRIRQLMAYGMPLEEIHDHVIDSTDEEAFFFAYQAAKILAKED